MNRREMLLENFKFIFSFLVRTCSASELEKALGYVQVSSVVYIWGPTTGCKRTNFLIKLGTK